jgi:hypothetical protein
LSPSHSPPSYLSIEIRLVAELIVAVHFLQSRIPVTFYKTNT